MRDKIALAGLIFVVGATLGQSLGILPALAGNPPITANTFDLVPFRGHIEKDGLPYSSTVSLRFRLFAGEAVAENDFLYEETIDGVQPAEGNFAVVLGVSGHDKNLAAIKIRDALRNHPTPSNPATYVGITVDGGTPLTGRQRLGAAPFASRVSQIRAPDIDPAQVNASHIADNAIEPRHLEASPLPCTAGQVPVVANGTTWTCNNYVPTIGPLFSVSVGGGNTSVYNDEKILHDDDGRTVCFLSWVGFYGGNTDETRTYCYITTDAAGHLIVRANRSLSNRFAEVTCEARCISW